MGVIDALARYFRVKREADDSQLEVVIDGQLSVSFRCEGDDLYSIGDLATLTSQDREKLTHLLQWNLARIIDGDGTLAYDPETCRLYFFQKKPLSELFFDNLFQGAEAFMKQLSFCWDAFKDVEGRTGGLPLSGYGSFIG